MEIEWFGPAALLEEERTGEEIIRYVEAGGMVMAVGRLGNRREDGLGMSAIDVALWDIKDKQLNVPI